MPLLLSYVSHTCSEQERRLCTFDRRANIIYPVTISVHAPQAYSERTNR